MNYYWLICQIFKHWSFIEEREWRLISVSGFDRQFCDVRVTNNTLLRYYKLQLLAADKIDEKNDLGFDEIFIGPQDQAERSLMNIRYLVDLQNIYPPALHYSESSYRKNK
jgi:hypothetical protein